MEHSEFVELAHNKSHSDGTGVHLLCTVTQLLNKKSSHKETDGKCKAMICDNKLAQGEFEIARNESRSFEQACNCSALPQSCLKKNHS